MTSLVQDIQVVRNLRAAVGRDNRLPSNILSSIEHIHSCIKSGTDLNGWKKVDWRDTTTNGSSNSKSSAPAYRPVSSSRSSRGGNNFFNTRPTNRGSHEQPRADNSNTTHYSGFGTRQKNNTQEGTPVTMSPSVPLTDSVSTRTVEQVNGGNTLNRVNSGNIGNSGNSGQQQTSQDGFRTVHPKYVSKFKKNSENVEDTILNTIILGKLNKFSEQNYDEIKEFITHIVDNGQTDMVKCFMKLVFEKAASEEIFCPLYAKLLSELSKQYPVLLSEMANLYSVYMAIFDEVVDTKAENYHEVCARNVQKKYRRGYSQFLAELIKYNVIDINIFMKTVNKIVSQIENNVKVVEAIKINEEYSDCLIKIMKALHGDAFNGNLNTSMVDNIKQNIKLDMLSRIECLSMRNSENTGISNKMRFTILDIFERIQKF
jgi:hypothetical protein